MNEKSKTTPITWENTKNGGGRPQKVPKLDPRGRMRNVSGRPRATAKSTVNPYPLCVRSRHEAPPPNRVSHTHHVAVAGPRFLKWVGSSRSVTLMCPNNHRLN